MGRFLRKIKRKIKQAAERQISDPDAATRAFEAEKPDELRKDIRMISGCEDAQTSADVSNVANFRLPDPHGRAGGACTSTLLNVLYADDKVPEDTLSFTQVLDQMRGMLKKKGFSQIPQLTSCNPIDVDTDFTLVPETATGTKRAVMIGINYVGQNPGELSGCHNDVMNMRKYIMEVHGFEADNITILMDDGEHTDPTFENIMAAYKQIVADSESGDAIFLHYSGHGTKLRDDDFGEEDDGYDEALVPVDYKECGKMIRDDDLYEVLVDDLKDGVHMVSLMDCCHSGTILDLPYHFKSDGSMHHMQLDPKVDLEALLNKFGGAAIGLLGKIFG